MKIHRHDSAEKSVVVVGTRYMIYKYSWPPALKLPPASSEIDMRRRKNET